MQTMPSPLPKSETLDTTQYVVLYTCIYPVDNFAGGFNAVEDVLVLQIGSRICKTFSQNLHLWDRNLSFKEQNKIPFRSDYVDFEIFNNYPQNKITVQHRIPNSRLLQGSTQVVEYTEPIPAIDWKIIERTDSIAGYSCVCAEGRFGGRDWVAWFTPQIPMSYGPWKLGGLPGLILQAEDASGDYKFEIQSVGKASELILRYDWHPVKMSKAKWMQTERKMYEHPKDYFSQNGEIRVMNNEGKPLEEELTIRYNPIELE